MVRSADLRLSVGEPVMSRTTTERAALESQRVRRVYSALAKVYDDCFDWALGPGRRLAVARLPIRPGQRVLEVGVGTGLSLPHYPLGTHITGIDISEPMLELGRERAERLGRRNLDLRLMDARELSYPDATFDHVLAPYVISVVPEPERVMREIARVCKPGGTVMVVNHFGSASSRLRQLERWGSALSQWVGFRLDLPVETVLATAALEPVKIERVNLLGLWRLIELRRRP
jgi:phosphatidylethanolamine/phosphatidyl-N-methylethanolamine N-methyltransferase